MNSRPSAPKPAPVFSVKKIHRPRLRLLTLIEIFLVILVVVGTVVGFLNYKKFSLTAALNSISSLVRPKQASQPASKVVSFEDKIRSLLSQNSLEVVSLAKTPEGNLVVETKQQVEIFFARNGDPDNQVATLQTILAKAKIDGKQVKKVDFRFENLVVEY